MEIGIIGLGKMGLGITKRLISNNHKVFGFDTGWNEEMYSKEGLLYSNSIDDVISKLPASEPKILWIMVPSGIPTEKTINNLEQSLNKGDIIIDGGNSYYKESIKRSEKLMNKGINFLDSGTSGGVWGEEEGYCLMVGGNKDIYNYCEPIFHSLASNNEGAGYMGKSGSGHFVKMIHNGIEYGMMQSMAEGFEILHAKKDFNLDLRKISQLWRHGSVVRSWLLDLMNNSLEDDPELSGVAPYVEDSGEGRWTVKESIDLDVPAHAITSSLYSRFYSRNKDSFGFKVLATLRNQFGGHKIKKIK
jgi:6-phosphogluconate dehydrogenase